RLVMTAAGGGDKAASCCFGARQLAQPPTVVNASMAPTVQIRCMPGFFMQASRCFMHDKASGQTVWFACRIGRIPGRWASVDLDSDVVEQARGQGATHDVLHRLVVVVAEPDADKFI